jgi:protein-arginine kinase activator protein McsA
VLGQRVTIVRAKDNVEITVCAACGEPACWDGVLMCEDSRTASTTTKEVAGYRCQFCGKTSPARQWRRGGEECPKCRRIYDAALAQEDP